MELKKFIKETLKDIIEGVHEAQQDISFGMIVPATNENLEVAKSGLTDYQKIDFVVNVNVVENEGSEAKVSVAAALIGGHLKGDNSSSSENGAKLSFTIPVKLPLSKAKSK